MSIFSTILLIIINIKLITPVDFSGRTPANIFIIDVASGDRIQATSTWNSSSTDVDIRLFQPGRRVSRDTSDSCQCRSISNTQTTVLTANSIGNFVVWAHQFSGPAVTYDMNIKKNGNPFLSQSNMLLSQNSTFQKVTVPGVPCQMSVKFISTGNFKLSWYAPGTYLIGGAAEQTMDYVSVNVQANAVVVLDVVGIYYLKIKQNPVSPSNGWSFLTYYNGSMQYESISDYIVGCLKCSTQKMCTQCLPTFTLTSSKCVFILHNCLDRSNDGFKCIKCDNGYFVDTVTNLCSACSAIALCQSCTSNISCTVCSGSNFFNQTLIQCRPCNQAFQDCLQCSNHTVCQSCTTEKYFDGSQCVFCNSTMISCLQCNVSGTCLRCDNLMTFVNFSNKCQTCSSAINACQQCSDSLTCTKCPITHILVSGSCQTCSSAISACQQCSDLLTCTKCPNTHILVSGSCQSCSNFISSCLNCLYISSSKVQCILCQSQYLIDLSTSKCQLCSDSIDKCEQCKSKDKCDNCENSYVPDKNTGNSSCKCESGWYVEDACTTTVGCTKAQRFNFSQPSKCLMCDFQNNFFYSSSLETCLCLIGYTLIKDNCEQKCGDGTHFQHQCDDKNQVSGDGCDSQCKIQSQYLCEGGSLQKSRCFLKLKPQIKHLFTIRNDGQNKAKIYFSVNPESYLYHKVSFLQSLKINDPRIKILNAYYLEGRLQVQFQFKENLQNQQLTVNFNFSKFFNLKSSSSITFHTSLMKPPLNVLQYNNFFAIISILGQVLAYLLLSLFFIGMFYHKIIALQIILVYQVIYCMGSLSTSNISTFRVLTSLRPVVGIFNIIEGSRIQLIFPQFLRLISVGRSLLLNLNISLVVFAFAFVTFIVLKTIQLKNKYQLKRYKELTVDLMKKCQKKNKKKLKTQIEQQKMKLKNDIFHSNRKAELVYERLFFPVGMFLFLPFLIMYAVNAIGSINGQPPQIQETSNILFQTTLIILITLFAFQTRKLFIKYKQPQQQLSFRSISDSIQKNLLNRYSSLILIFYTSNMFLILVGLIVLSSDVKLSLLISVFVSILSYIVYHRNIRPYIQKYHNKVVIYNNTILLLFSILMILDYFIEVHEIILLVSILVIFLMGYVAFVLSLCRLVLEHKLMQKKQKCQIQFDVDQRKNVKQLFHLNSYIVQKKFRKDFSFLADIKVEGQPNEEDNMSEKDGTVNNKAQLSKIKKRLRRQMNYMKNNQ